MLLQTKKFNFKSIVYACLVILVFNFTPLNKINGLKLFAHSTYLTGFTLVRADEDIVQESVNETVDSAPESEINSQIEEFEAEENSAQEEEIIVSQEENLLAVDEDVAVTESVSAEEAVENGAVIQGEINDLLETEQPENTGNISGIATGTEEIRLKSGQEPIIFIFNNSEADTESGSSTLPSIAGSDEIIGWTSASSSADSAVLIGDKTGSSTDPISSSTEESLGGGASRQNSLTSGGGGIIVAQLELIAQWQMLALKDNNAVQGSDDSQDVGVQLLPSGEYDIDKQFSVCALVANFKDASLINLSAIIYYPEDAAYSENLDRGCGQKKSEVELSIVSPEEATELVCDQIRNNNNNLLLWDKNENAGYDYDYEKVCGAEGFLAQNKASLFCADSALAFDDPAGEYQVLITAEDSQGNSDEARNILKYLELTIFENDFSDFQYGRANQGELKVLLGDSVWGNLFYPTVRNIGNTRLQIKIQQNDFNLGKTNGAWNIEYRTRVGENAEWLSYFPAQTAFLKDPLDLGAVTNIDFAILVKKYPENDNRPAFSGEMILSAEKVSGLACQK